MELKIIKANEAWKLDGKINAIDNSITNESQILQAIISELTFEPVIEFQLTNHIPQIPVNIFNKQGIYFFEIKIKEHIETAMWFENFSKIWKAGNVTCVPGIKTQRIRAHKALSEWVLLYLGKSKNVGGRITEHIHQIEGKTTFSMKLKARQNLLDENFRVSWIPLNIKNYNMLAPAIEARLRNFKNPIVGKQ